MPNKPDFSDPYWQNTPLHREVLEFLRTLTPRYAELSAELTDAQWSAFKMLAEAGGVEGILKVLSTPPDSEQATTEYYEIAGRYWEAMTGVHRRDRPFEARLVRARLTGFGEQWAAYLRDIPADPRRVREYVLSVVWNAAESRLRRAYATLIPPPAEPAGQGPTRQDRPAIPEAPGIGDEPTGGLAPVIKNDGRRLPNLGPHDRQAYQLWTGGMKQAAIADALNREHGQTYSQGQVSRMIDRVKHHAEASGLSELIPEPTKPAKPAKSIDPERLELGPRMDGRSRQQRPPRDSEES